jgi:hypothetical protein
MANTPRLVLPEIAVSQSSKEVTHNEALVILDALVMPAAEDKDQTSVSVSSASDGDTYIVASSGAGSWASQDGNIAQLDSSAWDFHTPDEGWATYVKDEDLYYMYNASSKWEPMFGSGALALLGTITANAQTTTKQTIFTVPTGRTMIPVAVCFREPSATLAGLVDLDIGGDASAGDWIQQVTLAAFTATTDYGFVFQPEQAAGPPIVPVKKTVYAATTAFGIKINTGSTGAANVEVDLFGYLRA